MKGLSTALLSIVIVTLFFQTAYSDEKVLRILHMNDFHGFAEPYKPYGSEEMRGGIAVLAARARELRREYPSLLVSAGDMIQGNNWANLFQGESVVELMNAMQFDAMVVGNHEFDHGQDVLKRRIAEARFPVLGANVRGINGLRPFVIKEIAGLKVGIIGVVTEETPVSTHPRNVAGLEFMSPAASVDTYVKELRPGVDLIVVLTHIGHSADRRLAEMVSGIDIIVGGHSHTRLTEPVIINNTVIVQAWEHGKALGVLDIRIKDGKITGFEGHLEEIKPALMKEDPTVYALVQKYKQRVDSILDETVGSAETDLDGENARTRETNLGNLITDVIRRVSGAEVTILNGGDIRTGIKKGDIKVKDVYSVLPFNDYIIAVRLTGKEIREALEHGVSAIDDGSGRFPQVAGLAFVYSASAPKGSRVREITVSGNPLDPDKEYVVATNDFLAAGGDGYTVFGDAIKKSGDSLNSGVITKGGKIVYNDSSRFLKDIVIEYIREKGSIAPTVEGRIREVN